MDKKYTEQDLIDACEYGYDYHKTSQFPEKEFEEEAINNFKQVLAGKEADILLESLKSPKVVKMKEIEEGQRVLIPVDCIEFNSESHTIWVQGKQGGTTMRIKCTGKINTDVCQNSPISHCDIIVNGDINFCLSQDAEL